MLIDLSHDDHLLECRNISFMSTVSRGPWYTKLYSPPLVAQFLKDISLEVHSGEIHGIVGVAGSGKSTLLDVIACRASGDVGGTVLLDKHLLTDSRFRRMCSHVDFRIRYPPFLTVRSLLYYQAKMCLGGRLQPAQMEERILSLLQEWELLGYGHETIGSLSESARRRVVIAMNLVKDPILLIVDDPVRHLGPLPSYQLMLCMQTYMKRHQRMAIVTMRSPRSDLYQLLSRLSILFYGELCYTGLTKKMPSYFKQLGYECPRTENPAIYYISLATVDRETTDRYLETQEQAVKLVEQFKVRTNSLLTEARPNKETYGVCGSTVALCFSQKPAVTTKFGAILRRTIVSVTSRPSSLFSSLFLLPLTSLLLCFYLVQFTGSSKTLPNSVAGQLTVISLHISFVASIVTTVQLSPLRNLSYIESSIGLYNGILLVPAYFLTTIVLHSATVLCSTAILLWLSSYFAVWGLFRTFSLFFSLFLFSQLHTMLWMSFVRRQHSVLLLTFTLNLLFFTIGGGFLKAFSTLSHIANWLPYASYANFFRYTNYGLLNEFVPWTKTNNCTRNEKSEVDNTPVQRFCRWTNGVSWMSEVYPELHYPQDITLNILFAYAIVFLLFLFVLLLYAVPKPKMVYDKFKYR